MPIVLRCIKYSGVTLHNQNSRDTFHVKAVEFQTMLNSKTSGTKLVNEICPKNSILWSVSGNSLKMHVLKNVILRFRDTDFRT